MQEICQKIIDSRDRRIVNILAQRDQKLIQRINKTADFFTATIQTQLGNQSGSSPPPSDFLRSQTAQLETRIARVELDIDKIKKKIKE